MFKHIIIFRTDLYQTLISFISHSLGGRLTLMISILLAEIPLIITMLFFWQKALCVKASPWRVGPKMEMKTKHNLIIILKPYLLRLPMFTCFICVKWYVIPAINQLSRSVQCECVSVHMQYIKTERPFIFYAVDECIPQLISFLSPLRELYLNDPTQNALA